MDSEIRQMIEEKYDGMEFTMGIHKESGEKAVIIHSNRNAIMQMYFLMNAIISIYPKMYRELKVLNEICDGYGPAEDLTEAMRRAMCEALGNE